MDFFLGLLSWSETLPRWQRPVVNGALLVVSYILSRAGGLIGLGIIFGLILYKHGLTEAARGLGLLPAAVIAGAIGGCAYVLLAPLRWLGMVGRWLSWVVAVAAYSIAACRFIGAIFPEESFALQRLSEMWDPAFMFAVGLTSLLFGSVGFWTFGREDDISDVPQRPSARGLLAHAIDEDLAELENAGATAPLKRRELAQVRANEPSTATVMHWWRVVDRLARQPGALLDWPPRWALQRAQARLHRAQRRKEASDQRRSRGDA